MKRILALMGVGILLFLAGVFIPTEMNVLQVEREVEVTPEWMGEEDTDAKQAYLDVKHRKALEAELSSLEANFEATSVQYDADKASYLEKKEQLEKDLGVYWRNVENVKTLIRTTFHEEPNLALRVAWLESEFIMQQSNFRYTAKNVPKGYKVGDREESHCIFQIHAPVHQVTADRLGYGDFRTNVESCVAMARVIYDQRGNFTAWEAYNTHLAMI